MSHYDIALGMDHTTLDQGVAQLYAKPEAREKLFKGQQTGTQAGLPYTATFDIQEAPTFLLEPPPADLWDKSVDEMGKTPPAASRPTENAFQLVLPTFLGSYTLGDAAPVSGTTKVIVFATVSIDSSTTPPKLMLSPASVWLDESQMGGWDKLILRQILKQVLTKVGQLLAGFDIPVLSISKEGVTLEFGMPVVSIAGSLLIAAASLKSGPAVDISGVTWPAKPLFVLASADVIKSAASQVVAKLRGQTKEGSGSYKSLLSYDYTAKLNDATVTPNPADMTSVAAAIDFGFSATVKPLGIGGPCAISGATGNM